MMTLSKEQIKLLLAKPERKKGKPKVDDSVREYPTWFKLEPKVFVDEDLNQPAKCDNPNCIDPRTGTKTSTGEVIKRTAVVNIKGLNICRYCFLDGYLLEDPNQEQLA